MSKIDFAITAERALNHADAVFDWLDLVGELNGKEFIAFNPTRNDGSLGSFKINAETGVWADFALGDADKGGDLVSLTAYVLAQPQGKAAELLDQFIGLIESGPAGSRHPTAREMAGSPVKADSKAVISAACKVERTKAKGSDHGVCLSPVPENAKALPESFGKLGKPSKQFAYCNGDGQLLGYILRFDLADGKKDIRPLTYRRQADGSDGWAMVGFDKPYPLFGLDGLSFRPSAPVMIVEGEKAAEAAVRLLPEFVVVTTMHGAKSVDKADLKPLAGRKVTIWPDNDEAGFGYQDALIEILAELDGEMPVSVIDVPMLLEKLCALKGWAITEKTKELEGWDAADLETMGIEPDAMRPLILDSVVRIEPPQQPEEIYTGSGERFVLSDVDGVAQIKKTKDGGERLVKVCSPLRFPGLGRDAGSMAWSLLTEVKTPDETWHRFSLLKARLTDMPSLKAEFLDKGCYIYNHDGFTSLLNGVAPSGRYLVARRSGWFEGRYLLGETVVGQKEEEPVMLITEGMPSVCYSQVRTSEQWHSTIGRYCIDNSRATFMVSFALAAPLLNILGMENGGVHFVGESSIGKTTLLKIGASVYGEPSKLVANWRATSNALESIAESRNDGVLFIDEMGQASAHEAGETVYMLGNGKGKGRATARATLARQREWRLLFASTGEVPLAQHMSAAGKQIRAGMEVRLLNIPANAGVGHGIYEELHGFESGVALAVHFNTAVNRVYGAPGLAWVEYLIEQVADNQNLQSEWVAELRRLEQEIYSERSEPQICRAAERFALVALAGELACRAGVLEWSAGTATAAVKTCFSAWLEERGGIGSGEELAAFRQVQQYFQRYGEARFQKFKDGISGQEVDNSRTVIDRAGYFRELPDGTSAFDVFPATFREQVCQGLDPKLVLSILEKRGLLVKGQPDTTRVVRVPGLSKSVRVYRVRVDILGAATTEAADEQAPDDDADQEQQTAPEHGFTL